jgi:hypothetical protein
MSLEAKQSKEPNMSLVNLVNTLQGKPLSTLLAKPANMSVVKLVNT